MEELGRESCLLGGKKGIIIGKFIFMKSYIPYNVPFHVSTPSLKAERRRDIDAKMFKR
jgi:hypothetical protein